MRSFVRSCVRACVHAVRSFARRMNKNAQSVERDGVALYVNITAKVTGSQFQAGKRVRTYKGPGGNEYRYSRIYTLRCRKCNEAYRGSLLRNVYRMYQSLPANANQARLTCLVSAR